MASWRVWPSIEPTVSVSVTETDELAAIVKGAGELSAILDRPIFFDSLQAEPVECRVYCFATERTKRMRLASPPAIR